MIAITAFAAAALPAVRRKTYLAWSGADKMLCYAMLCYAMPYHVMLC